MKKSLPLLFLLSLLLTTAGWSQTIDRSLKFELFRNGRIITTAKALDGSVFVGGEFHKIDGTPVMHLAKIKPSRELDNTFALVNPDASKQLLWVSNILPLPDGKLLITGVFRDANGYAKDILFRAEADGSADPSFASPFTDEVVSIYDVGMQSDGKLIVSAALGDNMGNYQNVVRRLNTDGSIDQTFSTAELSNSDFVYVVVVLPDDEIMLGGGFKAYNGDETANDLVRLNADGSYDDDFNANIADDDNNTSINNVWLMDDGSMFVRAFGRNLQKIEADGSPDASYAPVRIIQGSDHTIILPDGTTIAILSDEMKSYDITGAELNSIDFDDRGELLAFGDDEFITEYIDTEPNSTAAVISSELILEWKIFALATDDGSIGVGTRFLKQPDGKLIVRMSSQFYSDGTDLHPVKTWFRLNEDFSFDNTLTFPDDLFDNYMIPVFADSKGRIYMNNTPTEHETLLRFLSDGSLDESFTAVPGLFNDIVELGNSEFVGLAGRYQSHLVKFDESGTVDASVTYSSNYELSSITIGSDGKWYVMGGSPNFVQKLNTDGTPVADFGTTGSIGHLDVNRAEMYNDQIYVAAPFYDNTNSSNIVIYPFAMWSANGQGKMPKIDALKGRAGMNVAVDKDANRVYLLAQVFNQKKHELYGFRTDGTIDTRFKPIKYERASDINYRDDLILLNDKSLLILSDTLYHVVLPGLPVGPDNMTVSITGENIHIAWHDNSSDETVFEIWRSIDGSDFTLVGTSPANVASYTDQRGTAGAYTYRVYAANAGGVSEEFGEATLDVVTGLMELSAGLKIYPNPVKDHLQIEADEVVDRFTLLQLDGRTVESATPQSNRFTINMNSYATGLYLLKMENSNGKRVVKIFKQ